MRTCAQCGRQLGTDAMACTACGRPADVPPPTGMADLTRPIRPSQVLPAGHEPVRPTAKDILSGPVDLTQPARPQRTQAQPPAEFWADDVPLAAAGPLAADAAPTPAAAAAALSPASLSAPHAGPPGAVLARSPLPQGTWQPLPASQDRRQAHGRWLVFAGAAVVLLVAGGGTALAFAKLSHHDPPSRQHAAAGHGPAGQHSAPDSSRADSSAPASAQPVALAPGVAAQPDATVVQRLLDRYFTAIDRHHFVAFRHLLSPDARHGMTLAHFTAGYGSTADSSAVLRGLSVTSTGQVAAHVTFTSHQAAANSPTQSTCTSWNVILYLDRDGSSLLVGLPPAGYTASYAACS